MSGAAIAPSIAMPNSVSTISGPLGSTSATRSPRSTPRPSARGQARRPVRRVAVRDRAPVVGAGKRCCSRLTAGVDGCERVGLLPHADEVTRCGYDGHCRDRDTGSSGEGSPRRAARSSGCAGARRSRRSSAARPRPGAPRPRQGNARHVLAQGLHPADQALPGRLPLLHVRGTAATRRARVPDSTRKCSRSPAQAPPPAVTRLCSRSVTSPSDVTAWRGTSSRPLGCETTIEYLAQVSRARARGDRPPPTREPRRHDGPGADAAPGRLGFARGSCSRRSPDRLSERGRPHFGSPDKRPAARLETLAARGRARRSPSRPGS